MEQELSLLLRDLEPDGEPVTLGMRTYYPGRLWGTEVVLVFSRWGKVAASTSASSLITRFGVKAVIFTGVAGAADSRLQIGDIVVADSLIQHDFDARPIFPKWEIPLLDRSHFAVGNTEVADAHQASQLFLKEDINSTLTPDDRRRFDIGEAKAMVGLIASGDRFFASAADLSKLRDELPGVLCVEMEGAAVAQTCYEHGTPLTVIRTISDRADDHSDIDFSAFIQSVASKYSHGVIRRLLAVRRAPAQ